MEVTEHVEAEAALFDRAGGHETFRTLIGRFFDGVRADPALAAMYPADDWAGSERRLLQFFEEYWGGPQAYSHDRGAPLLKMRHMSYKITDAMAGKWAGCMHEAIASLSVAESDAELLHDYVERACHYLVNAD